MKALVIGLGSMGKRRIRNLKALGIADIVGFDAHAETAEKAKAEYGIALLPSLASVKKSDFGLIVISTPPGAHREPAKVACSARTPFFLELNLITAEATAIVAEAKRTGTPAFFSNTELFDRDIDELAKAIGTDFKGYFSFHLGQNIAQWHPWQKPGEHFIYRKEANGMRELLRVELPWMLKVFGDIAKVRVSGTAFETGSYGIDDYMLIELTFKNGVRGVLILDLLTPEVIKRFEGISAGKRITWDERANTIEVADGKGKSSIALGKTEAEAGYEFSEDAHLAEMKHVLESLSKGESDTLSFENERRVLSLMDRIERARHSFL